MLKRIIPLRSRTVLQLEGPDAKPFLQKILTQDINKLSPQKALYSAFLTPEGRYFSDFFIVESDGSIYIDLLKEHLLPIASEFHSYKMRMNLSFKDLTDKMYVFSVIGHGSELEDFCLLPLEGTCQTIGQSFAFVDPRLQSLGLRVLTVPKTPFPIQNIPRGTEDDYRFFRTQLGVSEAPEELIPGKSIILHHGLQDLNAIAWDKGCYPGQELMVRSLYRGQINKRTFPARIEGLSDLSQGALLRFKEETVGEMLSNCGPIGITLIPPSLAQKCEERGDCLTTDLTKIFPHTMSWMKL
jgi:folate-binding protein YgfZ